MECFLLSVTAMKQRKVRIKENSWLAKQAAKKLSYNHIAMVIGHTIYLYNTTTESFFARPAWVCHELKHVQQYERLGVLLFLIKYGIEYLFRGYRNNAFEIEARAAEQNLKLTQNYNLSTYKQYMQSGYEIVN